MATGFSKKLWIRFILFAVLTCIVLIGQLSGGVYEGHLLEVGFWFVLIVLPLLVTLVWLPNRNGPPHSAKMEKFIRFMLTFYAVLVLLTFLMQGVLVASKVPRYQTLLGSLILLLPFQGALVYYLAKGKKVFVKAKPGKEAMAWGSPLPEGVNIKKNPKLAENCKKLLVDNQIFPVLTMLQEYYKNESREEYNTMLMLQKKWNEFQRETSLNLISEEQKDLKSSRLSHSLLLMIEKIE